MYVLSISSKHAYDILDATSYYDSNSIFLITESCFFCPSLFWIKETFCQKIYFYHSNSDVIMSNSVQCHWSIWLLDIQW